VVQLERYLVTKLVGLQTGGHLLVELQSVFEHKLFYSCELIALAFEWKGDWSCLRYRPSCFS